jgi:hypothetical protein
MGMNRLIAWEPVFKMFLFMAQPVFSGGSLPVLLRNIP